MFNMSDKDVFSVTENEPGVRTHPRTETVIGVAGGGGGTGRDAQPGSRAARDRMSKTVLNVFMSRSFETPGTGKKGPVFCVRGKPNTLRRSVEGGFWDYTGAKRGLVTRDAMWGAP